MIYRNGNLEFIGAPNEVRSQKREKKKVKKRQTQVKEAGKGQNLRNSVPTPVARGGSGAKNPSTCRATTSPSYC